MVDIEITRLSSKGQVVIPSGMRKGLKEGEKFVIIRDGGRFILKSVRDFDKNIEEDMEFARRTEEAWKSYCRGEFKSMPADEFLKELEKW